MVDLARFARKPAPRGGVAGWRRLCAARAKKHYRKNGLSGLSRMVD